MNRHNSFVWLGLMLFALSNTAFALTEDQQARVKHLSTEMRCLVCQNQTIADSDAPLAHDLRREIETLIAGGASDKEVVKFMVQRYGEFVLYRPPLNKVTFMLWFGPFLLLLTGAWLLFRFLKKQKSQARKGALSAEEQARLKALLGSGTKNGAESTET